MVVAIVRVGTVVNERRENRPARIFGEQVRISSQWEPTMFTLLFAPADVENQGVNRSADSRVIVQASEA